MTVITSSLLDMHAAGTVLRSLSVSLRPRSCARDGKSYAVPVANEEVSAVYFGILK